MRQGNHDNSEMLCACSAKKSSSYLSDSKNQANRKLLRESKMKSEFRVPMRTRASCEHLMQPVNTKLPHVVMVGKVLQLAAPLDDGDPIIDEPLALLQEPFGVACSRKRAVHWPPVLSA
eukprot:4826387-Pleurochrysis_carterae.AAC.10